MGEGKETLKYDGGEEIKLCTECTYLGTKTDQSEDNTAEINHKISQTRKAISALNSIWWHKNISKNRKLYIYQTIIQSILLYGAEVWKIPTREINKILPTEIDVLRRLAQKSRTERIKNEYIKEIMGAKGKLDITDIKEKKRKTTMVWPHQKDARGQNTKINYGMDTKGGKEKRPSKKNVDGRSTSSHDNKKFRTRTMEKQRGMVFGFQETVTAVKKSDR